MNKRKNLNKYIIILTVAIIYAMCFLCACGKAETTEESSQEVLEVEQAVEETEELVEESVEESVEEPVVEEVVEAPQTVGQWSKSLDRTEPRLTIWNNDTKEGTILENGNQYTIKEGDQLVICYEGEETDMAIRSEIIVPNIASAIYKIYDIAEIPMEPTEIELAQTVNGVQYVYQVTLVSEDAVTSSEDNATPSESGDSGEVSGIEWVNSLGYDYPKLVVWNDEVNTKVELEAGQEYQMQAGDVLGVYGPTGYVPYAGEPHDWVTGIIMHGEHCHEILYNTSENTNPINFKIIGELGEDFIETTCTLLPPTE